MSAHIPWVYPYLFLSFAAFAFNVPMGYIRENTPKFSLKWFFWIHASIPFLVYWRYSLGISSVFIPASIFFAIYGQLAGGLLRKKNMSVKDLEALQQVALPEGCPDVSPSDAQVEVVLLNMGGPRTNADVRDFQKRLFSDPLLIRFPLSRIFQKPFAWLLIALRSKEAEKRYRLIGGGSPIFESTKNQAEAMRKELLRRGRDLTVSFSFNYSSPLPEETIHRIRAAEKTHLLPVSLYPHYSRATTGSNIHYLKQAAGRLYPRLRFLDAPAYHLHGGYIQAMTERILEQLKTGESLDDFYLLFSAHGLPLYFLTEGDLYPFQVAQTVGAFLKNLNRRRQWSLAYQSAVGPLQWLKPSTGDVLSALARRNVKKLVVVPISFVTDHIETTCEIDREYRAKAESLGISDFRMSKAVECHHRFISALADSVEEAIKNRPKKQGRLVDRMNMIC